MRIVDCFLRRQLPGDFAFERRAIVRGRLRQPTAQRLDCEIVGLEFEEQLTAVATEDENLVVAHRHRRPRHHTESGAAVDV